MFKNIENIQINKKTIAIIIISGFLLGLVISSFFPYREVVNVHKIVLDEKSSVPFYPANPQNKSNQIKE